MVTVISISSWDNIKNNFTSGENKKGVVSETVSITQD